MNSVSRMKLHIITVSNMTRKYETLHIQAIFFSPNFFFQNNSMENGRVFRNKATYFTYHFVNPSAI